MKCGEGCQHFVFTPPPTKAFHFQPLPRCVDQFSNLLKQSGALHSYTTSSILIPSMQKSAAIITMGFGSSFFVITWTEITHHWEVGEVLLHLLGLNSNKFVPLEQNGEDHNCLIRMQLTASEWNFWPDLNAVKIKFVSAIKSPSLLHCYQASDVIDMITFNRKVWISEQPIWSSFSVVLYTPTVKLPDFFHVNIPF